jgi:hypothetical protein
MDNREISAGASKFATLMAGLDTEWNKTVKKADPNDPTVAAKFLEEWSTHARKDARRVQHREFDRSLPRPRSSDCATHFVTKTSADMATLAGVAAKIEHQQPDQPAFERGDDRPVVAARRR